jgi:hypothetical protein
MLRAVRAARHGAQSSIVWNYGHATIPRHLRDLYISEYGIADVRGLADEDCVMAMAGIADTRFQSALLDEAKRNRKLRHDFVPPAAWARNTPASLRARLAPLQADGTLPDYPLGSDFTEVEQRLVKALGWLKANTASTGGKLRTVMRALGAGAADDKAALARMRLAGPRGPGEWLEARLLALALRATRSQAAG